MRSGELLTLMPGVYVVAADWLRLALWDRYLVRVHAAALHYPHAVFVLESAGSLRGLPTFLEPRDVHIALPPSATSRVHSGVRIHTAQRMPAFDEIGGLAVATAADVALDIARLRHNAIGLAVAGSAMRADPEITVELLIQMNAARHSSRGRRHAMWVLDRVSAIPESPLEYVSQATIEWLGFPAPELQHWIRGRGPDDDRLDFWFAPWRIAGEADGGLKYTGSDGSDAWRRRSIRDARLLERGVRATAHWGWHDVVPAAPLRAILVAAGLPVIAPPDVAQLATMRRALTPR